MSDSVTNKQIN